MPVNCRGTVRSELGAEDAVAVTVIDPPVSKADVAEDESVTSGVEATALPKSISNILIPRVGPVIINSSALLKPVTPLKSTNDVEALAIEAVVLPIVAPSLLAVKVVVMPSSAAFTTLKEIEFKPNSEPFEDLIVWEEKVPPADPKSKNTFGVAPVTL